MLSRRRSSEQPSEFPIPPASPSLARLENALRGVHVLFSTIAEPDCLAAPSIRSSTGNNTDGRSTPPLPTLDPPLRRRLFSRDARPDRQRRGTMAPPIQRLVVAVSIKNPTHVRLYHLHDYASAPRVSVSRAWNLADLRKIDGLGQPVSESVRFGLFFTSGKMLVWRTPSPSARAAFLWSLLQTCATRLKRAPPVQHLRLLDLQTFADNPCPSFHSQLPEPGADDSSSTNYAPSDKSNMRLASTLDELPQDQASQSPRGDTRSVTFLPSNSPALSDTKAPDALAPAPFRTSPASPIPLRPQYSPRGAGHRIANPPAPRHIQDESQNQRVTRTLSEPKVIASVPKQSESSQALTLQPRMRDKTSRLQTQKSAIANMDIDERAFQAAAKRMGAKQSEPICKAVILEQFANVGTNTEVRASLVPLDASVQKFSDASGFQQKKDPNISTLSSEELTDLAYSLDLYTTEVPSAALPDFGTWAESHIQTLEVDNIADIISSENRASMDSELASSTDGQHNPFELLVDSVQQHSAWLEKSETLLAPYANLAEDINKEVTLLQLQRKNVADLDNCLSELITAITCTGPNVGLFNDLDVMELPTNPLEVNFTELFQAIDVISSKSQALETLSGLSDMAAVAKVRGSVVQKQQKVSNALLPCLQKVLSMHYDVLNERESNSLNISLMRLNTTEKLSIPVLCELCKGARYLCVCDDIAYGRLIDHYVAISLNRIQKLVQYLVEVPVVANDKKSLDGQASCVLDSIFYACLSECFHMNRLFGSSIDSPTLSGNDPIQSIVQRQVPPGSFVEQHLQKIANGDNILKSCLLLHFSYTTRNFCQWLEECTDVELQAIIHRVDAKFCAVADIERNDLTTGPAWAPIDSDGRLRHQNERVSRKDRLMSQFLISFTRSCNTLAMKCFNVVEEHVSNVIALMGAPREIGDPAGRATFFKRMKDSVDLCKGLASPTFQGVSEVPKAEPKTRLLCEKLIAAAMRNIEVTSSSGPKSCGNTVKLQCYGYIAGCLTDPKQGFLVELANLSSRVRKHVMRKWAEDCVNEVTEGFELDTFKQTPGALDHQLCEFILDLKSSDVADVIKQRVRAVMEDAAETSAITALYSEVLGCIKERMEEIIRCVKKDRSMADIRSQLLAFTRELLADFRGEMKKYPVLFSAM